MIDVSDPMHPRLPGEFTGNFLRNPHCVAIQFRYAFVTDDDGLKVLDITDPDRPVPVPAESCGYTNAGRFYVARTYAYVANGPEGLAIIDVENPERPRLDQMFNAGGALNDTRAVQIGSVNASQFALVADGRNGLRVVQLISPDTVPGAQGFSPRPNPSLIATYPTKAKRSAFRAGSSATGSWMRLADRRWSSAGAGRGRFNYPKCCRSSDVSRPANFTGWKT